MRLSQFLAVGCLSFFSLASHAEILTGLYQVREPVASQSPDERIQATQKALTSLRLRERQVAGELDIGMQGTVVPRDALEQSLGNVDRAQRAVPVGPDQLRDRKDTKIISHGDGLPR